ncbi:methyl-accepting chemotaxis protein [Anaerosporobacter faecicola]|uniref:methyl-accepting chemotaxis protein n=1 Tax=Anaerosporobacter faecicola TaxID=2718714 RepID=UPI001EE5ABE4|nr:methyl-accepting chemotaxis protein [Anaerosporobacter faecicola]
MGEEQNQNIVKELKEIADKQSKYLEGMLTVMDNLYSSQQKVEQNAFDSINSADTSLNLVKEGMESIKELSDKITVLTEAVSAATKNMENMEKMTSMIMGFANVIAGISNKTNMLSLNASIEAARAGEHGRGFAVVANQVNQLAAQSAKASKEISDTMKSVVSFNESMGADMNKILEIVDIQNSMATSVDEVFKKILDAAYASNEAAHSVEHEVAYQRDVTEDAKKSVENISDTLVQVHNVLK